MDSKTLHKAVNTLTVIAGASDPDKNRSGRLAHLKQFSESHNMTRSDWEAAKKAAIKRLPSRLNSTDVE